ncbi:membrane-spanning 4-domains subfamily A member 15 isoform X1 [Brachyhypopomus gauderio]|uniref:membrane-spanning 4-domains subfamily A member 15 isoform X1 n=1 Tax=Brachyhypopomus gauderio TaxID=698409 RepID=UPI004041D78B
MTTSSGRKNLPADGAEPAGTTITGGQKPLHRFLRGEPKCVGIVMLLMGFSMFMFGFPLKADRLESSADLFSSFWLGILYAICGALYVQSERAPTKKIITISFALSIISILGTVFAVIDFIKAMANMKFNYHREYYDHDYENSNGENTTAVDADSKQRFMQHYNLEAVFLFQSLVGGVILITMSTFARMALHSSRTQMVVVMRNLPAAE